jgi:hypothetical protein
LSSSDERIRRSRAVELLAATLGEARALALWEETLNHLGLPDSDSLLRAHVLAAFDAISAAPGIVGVAGRYARLRLDHVNQPPPSSARSSTTPLSATAEPAKDLLGLLAPSVGEEKAKEAILQAAKALGLSSTDLTRPEALQILDVMAKSPGLLGVAARFGKARFLLRQPP